MKKTAIILLVALITVISAFTISKRAASGIHGTVNPSDGARQVWALNGKDSVSTVPMSGSFSIDLKPGKWKIHVVPSASYQDAYIEDVRVENGKYTDVGEIKLTSAAH